MLVKVENKDRAGMKSPANMPQSPHATADVANDVPSGTLQEDKEFKLAPTPAQLGKAPLQRRQSMGKWLVHKQNG